MRKKISSYHFINVDQFMVPDSLHYIKELNESGAIICFDLEDSIPSNFAIKHKENIIAIIKQLIEEMPKTKLGIRINNPESISFNSDIKFLKLFNKYFNIEAVFIPKINNLSHIISAADTLKINNVEYNQVIPIIETKSGMNNITEIARASNNLFHKVAFGHADYNFDMECFPFFHQNSTTYWNWINEMLNALEPNGKSLVNSPLLFLNNEQLFFQMLSKLNSICKNQFGQITLTSCQTKLCKTFTTEQNISGAMFSMENKEYAEYIIDNYVKYKSSNHLIAIEQSKRYLISPQEFKAAKIYLKKNAQS